MVFFVVSRVIRVFIILLSVLRAGRVADRCV